MRFIIPENAATHFHLHHGDVVADFGAGSGYFERALSEDVGSEGVVYACEVQASLVHALERKVQIEHLSNVKVIRCDIESPGMCAIADGALDAGLLSNTLFQLEDKESAIKEIVRMMRVGAKLFILEWSESFGNLGPRPEDVVTEERAQEIVCGTGKFRFERSFPAGAHHYGLAFRRV